MTPQPVIASDKLDTSSRTYFFDVRESQRQKKYLTIKESYSRQGQRHEAIITIWPEDAGTFRDKLTTMLSQLS